eukprot:CAMPEP_0171206618 /NCGR_PEP_ID=MMETSP0790-20130122/27155_1 /TAXON_ID=2925 /ORGANISM="Alexandrium catenella, Strain OF101" /LENGTH=303 /DNA_ID=CAMNT_0011672167 /DNA_START=63 /DNA_END=974 /DNA_ORIENTATION=+
MTRRLRIALLAALGAAQCAGLRLTGLPDEKTDEYGLHCMDFDKTNMEDNVTAVVTTSPRAEDASGKALEVLKDTVRSIRDVLGLKRARIVVAFDALPDAEDSQWGAKELDEAGTADYWRKLREFEEWNQAELGGHVTVFKNDRWTHQGELIHRVLESLVEEKNITPMLYVTQDDSPVSGDINVPLILNKLSCDATVDYVRFLWSNDCDEGHATSWNQPCEQHKDTPFLHSVGRMSDRPHFATARFYFKDVLPRMPRSYRGVPERKVAGIKTGWIYGERHHMLHDTNKLQNSNNGNPEKRLRED